MTKVQAEAFMESPGDGVLFTGSDGSLRYSIARGRFPAVEDGAKQEGRIFGYRRVDIAGCENSSALQKK